MTQVHASTFPLSLLNEASLPVRVQAVRFECSCPVKQLNQELHQAVHFMSRALSLLGYVGQQLSDGVQTAEVLHSFAPLLQEMQSGGLALNCK